MATFTLVYSFVEALAEKVHNLGSDTFAVALTNTAPTTATTTLASITEISYTNLSTRTVGTAASSAQTAGVYKLVLPDLTLTASGAVDTFRYVTLYNATASGNVVIGWYDYGSAVTMANGETFLIDFDGSAGVLTIT